MKLPLILLCLVSFFWACDDNGEKESNDSYLAQKKFMDSLQLKFNIGYKWDTLNRVKYTNDFKEVLKSEKQILGDFKILDFYEKDSLVYVFLKGRNYPYVYFNLLLNKNQENKLRANGTKKVLIINSIEVKKNNFFSYVGTDETDDRFRVINDDPNFLVEGNLIEIAEFHKNQNHE